MYSVWCMYVLYTMNPVLLKCYVLFHSTCVNVILIMPTTKAHLPCTDFHQIRKCSTGPTRISCTKFYPNCIINMESKGKRESNFITGLDRPWGFQEAEAPTFQDNWHTKVVKFLYWYQLDTKFLYKLHKVKFLYMFRATSAHLQEVNDVNCTCMQPLVFSFSAGGRATCREWEYQRLHTCTINPLNPKLNPICYLLALLAHHFLHVSRIRVKSLTLMRLMSYIYIYIWSTYSWCF